MLHIKKTVLFDTLGIMIDEQSRVTHSYKGWFYPGDIIVKMEDVDVMASYESKRNTKGGGACC